METGKDVSSRAPQLTRGQRTIGKKMKIYVDLFRARHHSHNLPDEHGRVGKQCRYGL